MKDRLCNHNWNCEILSKWSRSTCNNGLNPLFPDEFGNGSGQELSRVHVKKEGYRSTLQVASNFILSQNARTNID